MRFKLDKPASPLLVNSIKAIFWLIRILLIASFLLSCFVFVVFVVDLVNNELIYDYIRSVFDGEESINKIWLFLPLFWLVGWLIQKYLLPWVKLSSSDQLLDLFQMAKDYPVIETYLAEVSGRGRMVSRKEYYSLVKMVKKDVKQKYWELGKE